MILLLLDIINFLLDFFCISGTETIIENNDLKNLLHIQNVKEINKEIDNDNDNFLKNFNKIYNH